MSERWKYQLKMGGFWGVFMMVFMTLFELQEKPFMEQITSYNFYLRAIFYIAFGIFVLGYFNWKQMQKNKS